MGFFAVLAALTPAAAAPPALGPYPLLHGGARTGAKVPSSPDPLVDYKWDMSSIDRFAYQTFVDQPVSALAEPAAAFSGVGSMTSAGSTAAVHAAGVITARFPQEGACWVEFESKGLAASGAKMDMTISENRLPGEVHNLQPKAWPRGAAFAERMWSARAVDDPVEAAPRLARVYCRLEARGVQASPIGPGSCYATVQQQCSRADGTVGCH